MWLTQHLIMVSVFISCFTAHGSDVWALGAQGFFFFFAQHFINLPAAFSYAHFTRSRHVHTLTLALFLKTHLTF